MYTLYKRIKEIQKLKVDVDLIAKMLNELSNGIYPNDSRIMDVEFNAGNRKVEFTIISDYDEPVELETSRRPVKIVAKKGPCSRQVDPPTITPQDDVGSLDISTGIF